MGPEPRLLHALVYALVLMLTLSKGNESRSLGLIIGSCFQQWSTGLHSLRMSALSASASNGFFIHRAVFHPWTTTCDLLSTRLIISLDEYPKMPFSPKVDLTQCSSCARSRGNLVHLMLTVGGPSLTSGCTRSSHEASIARASTQSQKGRIHA